MAESKVDAFKRDIIWKAVRNFGQGPWTNNAREKAEGQPRIVPQEQLSIPPLMTWTEYRAQLFTKGIRSTPTPQASPDYCESAKLVKF